MTEREMNIRAIVNEDDGAYGARVLRTEVLRKHAAAEVAKLVRAFVPPTFHIRIERDKLVCDANKIVGGQEVFPFVVTLLDKRIGSKDPAEHEAASDAHIFVAARTLEGALGKLLAIILDGGGFFPLT